MDMDHEWEGVVWSGMKSCMMLEKKNQDFTFESSSIASGGHL